MSNFKIIAKDGDARAGVLKTAHGEVNTPTFMPVGTQGSVKALSPDDLISAKSQIILGNTYHLYLRPGNKLIKNIGGLHKFMDWGGSILTDSGGFQVFSLGAAIEHGVKKIQNSKGKSQNYNKKPEEREKKREKRGRGDKVIPPLASLAFGGGSEFVVRGKNRKTFSAITEDGIIFQSHLDGSAHLLTPEKSIQIQLDLGSDIVLVLDELLSPLHDETYVKKSLERTHRWELIGKKYFEKHSKKSLNPSPTIFGILQGVYDKQIRANEAKWIANQGFDGVSIGGSFGTSKYWPAKRTVILEGVKRPIGSTPGIDSLASLQNDDEDEFNWAAARAINETFEWVVPLLPEELPRHGLGIGEVKNLFDCVARGIDMFDCVSPTRRARNGSLYISPKNGGISRNMFALSIQRAEFKGDEKPIDPGCGCYTCQNFSRSYLRHLYVCSELLYHRLASIHNVYFINNLMAKIREAILEKQFKKLKDKWLEH